MEGRHISCKFTGFKWTFFSVISGHALLEPQLRYENTAGFVVCPTYKLQHGGHINISLALDIMNTIH